MAEAKREKAHWVELELDGEEILYIIREPNGSKVEGAGYPTRIEAERQARLLDYLNLKQFRRFVFTRGAATSRPKK